MNPSNTIIVISRYQSDTSWTKEFTNRGYVTLIYEHGEFGSPSNPYNIGTNRGKEASVYLKYIIDKYDSLPDYTIFLHDKLTAWNHEGKLTDLVLNHANSTNKNAKYYNFNNKLCGTIKNDYWSHMKKYFKKYLSPYIGGIEYYGDFTVNELCCAKFTVHKSKILQHDKKMYLDLFKWITTTNIDHEITGRLMEWTWRLIFNPKQYKLRIPLNIESPEYINKIKNNANYKNNVQIISKRLKDKGYKIIS